MLASRGLSWEHGVTCTVNNIVRSWYHIYFQSGDLIRSHAEAVWPDVLYMIS